MNSERITNRWNSNEYNYFNINRARESVMNSGRDRGRSRSRERVRETRNIDDEILEKRRELANLQRENDYIQSVYRPSYSEKNINVNELLQSAVYDGARSTQILPPPLPLPPQYYSDLFSREQAVEKFSEPSSYSPTTHQYQYYDSSSKIEPKSRIIIVKSENIITSRRNFIEKIKSLLLSSKDGLVNGSNFPYKTWPQKLDGSSYSKLSEIAKEYGINTKYINTTFYFSL
jgi:hypothetical protein